jgi:TetR/AcrR family transcriptional repressor of nem operon
MPRRENSELRAHIVKTAYARVFEGGYKGVSMGDIAAAAGIKKANLFHYYPSKEALALAVFDFAAQDARRWIDDELGTDGDPIELIEGLFDSTAALMDESACSRGCFVGNVAQELSNENEAIRRRVAEVLDYWHARLVDVLEQGIARGRFRAEIPSPDAAEAVLALFEGAVLLAKARKHTAPLLSARRAAGDYLRGFVA